MATTIIFVLLAIGASIINCGTFVSALCLIRKWTSFLLATSCFLICLAISVPICADCNAVMILVGMLGAMSALATDCLVILTTLRLEKILNFVSIIPFGFVTAFASSNNVIQCALPAYWYSSSHEPLVFGLLYSMIVATTCLVAVCILKLARIQEAFLCTKVFGMWIIFCTLLCLTIAQSILLWSTKSISDDAKCDASLTLFLLFCLLVPLAMPQLRQALRQCMELCYNKIRRRQPQPSTSIHTQASASDDLSIASPTTTPVMNHIDPHVSPTAITETM